MRRAALGVFVLAGIGSLARAEPADEAAGVRTRIVTEAADLLDQALVSYVYGGYQVGDSDACKECNDCLATREPAPKRRLIECPDCKSCSLDCSHFANRVFDLAGAHYPYLDTATMLALTGPELKRRYGLVDLETRAEETLPGDLLVYDGHVVVLERRHAPVEGQPKIRGDIVHATGGRVIRRAGEGVQRERFVDLTTFRGPLRRILRHGLLSGMSRKELPSAPVVKAANPVPAAAERGEKPIAKLRRIEKRPAKPE